MIAYISMGQYMYLCGRGHGGTCNRWNTAYKYDSIDEAKRVCDSILWRMNSRSVHIIDENDQIVHIQDRDKVLHYVPSSIGHGPIFEILDDIKKYNQKYDGKEPSGNQLSKGHHFIWLKKDDSYIVIDESKFPTNSNISALMTGYDCSYEDALQIAGVPLKQIHRKINHTP